MSVIFDDPVALWDDPAHTFDGLTPDTLPEPADHRGRGGFAYLIGAAVTPASHHGYATTASHNGRSTQPSHGGYSTQPSHGGYSTQPSHNGRSALCT